MNSRFQVLKMRKQQLEERLIRAKVPRAPSVAIKREMDECCRNISREIQRGKMCGHP